MPSIRYMNQSAPFWDFIANLEQQGAEHPMLAGRTRGEANERESSDEEGGWTGPWGWGWGWPGAGRGWHQGPPPYPGAHPPHPPGHHHDGPNPPPGAEGPPAPPGGPADESTDPPESVPPPHPPHEGHEHRGRRGRHHEPHGEHHRRGRCGGRGGFRAPWGRRGMGAFNMSALSDFIQSQMMDTSTPGASGAEQDFKPEADIFDTESAFVVHVSLPGAKKEDVAVNWDAEKSELSIAGVVHRPGDEEFLKTLALDERKVGAFERKIRLGSRANPAQVDVDGISAKFEDGILIIMVPKEDKDFVEVKKVDIE